MTRFFQAILAFALCAGAVRAETFSEMFPNPPAGMPAEVLALLERLDYKQGTVSIGSGYAEIEIGENFYFLNSWDARAVLEELWGNPPEETLGMIFPARYTAWDAGSWGIEIQYEAIGYVSDEDAASYDYDALLREMQAETLAQNDWLRENGYQTVQLIGWAAAPHYDAQTHQLYWAKELQFEGSETNTLNYNIRVLGRKGVLNLNFIADMQALPEVEAALPEVLSMVRFTEGNRYGEFDPALDQVADASIGSLISGGALANAGLVAVALVFLKKFWFLLLIPLFWLKGLFTGRRSS